MAFQASLSVTDGKATIELIGELDSSSAPKLHEQIEEAIKSSAELLELRAVALTYMSSAGLRALLFARQKMGETGAVVLVGAPEPVTRTIRLAGLENTIQMSDA
ncbi:MAG TPA: STAS domain-containing protein [Streptosporangiaceae bacterium]|nr:STAS domain-containing protein [Streptosporangiaceae bacterium]